MRVSLRYKRQLRSLCCSAVCRLTLQNTKSSPCFVRNDSAGEKSHKGSSDSPSIEGSYLRDPHLFTERLRRPFLNPTNFFPDVEITDPAISTLALEHTFQLLKEWQQLCRKSTSEPVVPGSIIEFITANSELQLGVVLRKPSSQFHHFHNRMIVLAMNNELVRVHSQDLTFVANEVYDCDWIKSLDILQNRFNEAYESRTRLVQLVHYFLATARKFQIVIEELSPQVYSHVASSNGASPVSLLKLVNTITAFREMTFISYLHQSAFLLAIHHHLCSDFKHWIVPGCMPLERTTNLSLLRFSNSVPAVGIYFSTPISLMAHCQEFMSFGDQKFVQFDDFVSRIFEAKPSYDDLTLAFTIWEGKEFYSILQMIKFAIVYPHVELLKQLSKSSCFGPSTLSQRTLYEFLVKLGIYENSYNYMSDPLLSAEVAGELKPLVLAASSLRDLKASSPCRSVSTSLTEDLTDKFRHLRSKQFFSDHVIYIVPGCKGNVAVSLEKANSRKYFINFHVVDPTTKLSPSSDFFVEWVLSTALLNDWNTLKDSDMSRLLPRSVLEKILFSESDFSKTSDYFRVGDVLTDRKAETVNKFQSCMTIKLEYNPSQSDLLKNLSERISVSFDDISKSKIISLDSELLEFSLLTKGQSSILGTLRLFDFSKAAREKQLRVGEQDHQNLNFVFSFLKIHFMFRNRNYATVVEPSGFKEKLKKIHSFDKRTGAIAKDLQLQTEAPCPRSLFFKEEVQVALGALCASFCNLHKIPVYYQNQTFADKNDSTEQEGVMIKHNNSFFPEFTANSYFLTAFARDASGYVSALASLFAFNHLSRVHLEPGTHGSHISYGLEKGFVNVSDPTENVEAFLNQLQMLAHVHFRTVVESKLVLKMTRFAYLKALGYHIHGPMDVSVLQSQANDLECASIGANYFRQKLNRYWLLKKIEQDPYCFPLFTCIITLVHEDSSDPANLSTTLLDQRQDKCVMISAYCEELELEVLVLIPADMDCKIGRELIATRVISIDAISGQIVLK